MTLSKKKKIAVVVGATGNLGLAIVADLKKAGYKIDETWNSPNHPDAKFASSYEKLPPHIDLAVYAAGINLVKPVQEITEQEWDEVLNVNLKGAFLFARAAFSGLKEAKGTFVTVTSMNAWYAYPNLA
ncbi:MAG: SDR family oxidoreductase, partial [Patescibacteria group bacterium]